MISSHLTSLIKIIEKIVLFPVNLLHAYHLRLLASDQHNNV